MGLHSERVVPVKDFQHGLEELYNSESPSKYLRLLCSHASLTIEAKPFKMNFKYIFFFLQRPYIGLYCFTSVIAPSSTEQTSALCSGWASLGCLLLVKVTSWDLNQDFLSPALRLAPWTTFCSQDFEKSVKQLVQFVFVHKVKMKCKDFASESFTKPSCRKHCVSRKQYFRSESFVRFFQRLITCLL